MLTGSPVPIKIGCIEATEQKREGKIKDRIMMTLWGTSLPSVADL